MTPGDATAALAREYKARPFAAFTTGDGTGLAWLVRGEDAPVGYVDAGDGSDPVTFTDMGQWQAAAEKAGMTTPNPDAEPPEVTASPAGQDQPDNPGASDGPPPIEPDPADLTEAPADGPAPLPMVDDPGVTDGPQTSPDIRTDREMLRGPNTTTTTAPQSADPSNRVTTMTDREMLR